MKAMLREKMDVVFVNAANAQDTASNRCLIDMLNCIDDDIIECAWDRD